MLLSKSELNFQRKTTEQNTPTQPPTDSYYGKKQKEGGKVDEVGNAIRSGGKMREFNYFSSSKI